MAPADLFFLTFNCAKTLINTTVFANHLETALGQNATELPDLVVLSLQEVAPLSYAFIGDYFLRPYIERFDTAINQAALQYVSKHDELDAPVPSSDPSIRRKEYTLMKSKNVGCTAILLFAKDSSQIRSIEEAEVGFGAADMGNKGAVGLRAVFDADDSTAEMTFVATHLAAMEWNLPRRNANWASIMRCMTFGDPGPFLNMAKDQGRTLSDGEDEGYENSSLLRSERGGSDADSLQKRLHDLSLFKPTSYLFVGGDLNYRISTTPPLPGAAFPSMDTESDNYYPHFFQRDQLNEEKSAGRTLHGLTEAAVHFPPTYKYDVLKGSGTERQLDTVPWKFALHRYPSWTDRILYLDLPSWTSAKYANSSIEVRAYDALPLLRTSDHRPVFLRIKVPVLEPSDLTPPVEAFATSSDPRVRLPTDIDPEAWGRRIAARRREVLVGWSMFLWSTKEGAYILTTILIASIGGYWVFC